jgi:hypothetical protein
VTAIVNWVEGGKAPDWIRTKQGLNKARVPLSCPPDRYSHVLD